MDHAFVIPAYGRPQHLEACVRSIQAQVGGTPRLLICTSTPSDDIRAIAAACGVPLVLNPRRADIATDWNFALDAAGARFVTIAHQDDLYDPAYLGTMQGLAAAHPGMVMAFSDYRELAGEQPRPLNLNLRVKRRLCERAFRGGVVLADAAAKRRLLELGNPVCCPSVMFNRQRLPAFRFSSSYRTNLDWDAWLRLADEEGEFVYDRQVLVHKRVHAQSETTVTIASNVRRTEDLRMFRRFWPRPVAAMIAAAYSIGYLSNRT